METYSKIPSQFVVGDTLIIDLAPGDFPPPGFALQLVLVSSSSKVAVDSTESDGYHRLTVDTSSLTPGRYDYQLKAIGTGFRRTIQSGFTIALLDFAAASVENHDGRSHVKKVLDALEAAIEGRASKTQLKHEFDGVAIEHMTLDEQVTLRDKYKLKYQRELAAASGTPWRTITPRFPA